jgi:SAM-dependent methyltransferase
MRKSFEKIVEHYENCYLQHGDNHLGMDWPNLEDNMVRFKVMLQLIDWDLNSNKTATILDFGCGTAHMLEYIWDNKIEIENYIGLDYSKIFIEKCKEKFPNQKFICGDILERDFHLPDFDYAVMNGVFTERNMLSNSEMWSYFSDVIAKVFYHSKRGIAFNTMSKNVDWERDDLFHVSLDELTNWLTKNLSRNVIVRQDYGLYEFTTYLYK